MNIEVTQEEAQLITTALDETTKGLGRAQMALSIVGKLQQALQIANEPPEEPSSPLKKPRKK